MMLAASFFVAVAGLPALVFGAATGPVASETQVLSPDGQVQFNLSLSQARLSYAVAFRGQPVIERSALGMLVDGTDLTDGVEIGEAARYEVNEIYSWRGVHSKAANHCRGARFVFKHRKSRTEYTLEVRAFDDGVGFRFIIPGGGEPRVPDEATQFNVPAGSVVWRHNLRGHYEAEYEKSNIADVPAGDWAAPPVTFQLPGGAGYASITEAALVNYSGMALRGDGRSGFDLVLGHKQPVSYPFELRYKEDITRLSEPAVVRGVITTPWRVVMVGPDLNMLVNSDVVPNLCAPPDPKLFPGGIKTDWIKPGRAVWKYLDGGPSTLEGMKEFSRMAGELGFEYHVIEGFWSRWSDDEVRELVEYSRQQGVGLWLWIHSKELRTAEDCAAFFKRLHDFGVVGAKIDFFDHEHKEVVDLYPMLLQEAAKHRVLVNFHGANKPTGEARTWPNELVREGVRGMESSRLKERARHDATLPFTRFLAGHADYTPVHFGERRADTTWTHQIATAAVFTAPLLTYAAHPANILQNLAVEMIKSVPAVWDETVVLPVSEIGEIAAFARRSGNTWFLAVINGPVGRTVRVPLAFLGQGEYRAMMVRDHKIDTAAVEIDNATARRSDVLTIELSNGGGFIARFSKADGPIRGAETPEDVGANRRGVFSYRAGAWATPTIAGPIVSFGQACMNWLR